MGPTHIIEIIIPKIEEILEIANVNYVMVKLKEQKDGENNLNKNKNEDLMEIEQEQYPSATGEKANLTFTNTAGQNQIFPSLILSDPNPSQNVFQSSFPNVDKITDQVKEPIKESTNIDSDLNLKRKYSEERVLKSFFVYYALKVKSFVFIKILFKESAIVTLNYASLTEINDYEFLFNKLTDIFGEDLLENLIKSDNMVNESILNLGL